MADNDKPVTVSLGKKDWPIPELSGRRIIKFTTLAAGVVLKNDVKKMSEDDFMRVYEIIFVGVQQGNPELTFEQFLDNYSIKYEELLTAFPIVAKQAGMDTTKDSTKGEAAAESLSKEP